MRFLKYIEREERFLMEGFGSKSEVWNAENKSAEIEGFKNIKPQESTTFQENKEYWNNLFKNGVFCKLDVEMDRTYFSEYTDRLKQVPTETSDRGTWDGKRGESKFTPNEANMDICDELKKRGFDGIEYKDAIPDFSDFSEATVEISDMTENRAKNFVQCDEQCAKKWNEEGRDGREDWTARDVANWRKENGYSWHERNDMKTCDLVPSKINDFFGHLGGVSECKKRDAKYSGGGFDE